MVPQVVAVAGGVALGAAAAKWVFGQKTEEERRRQEQLIDDLNKIRKRAKKEVAKEGRRQRKCIERLHERLADELDQQFTSTKEALGELYGLRQKIESSLKNSRFTSSAERHALSVRLRQFDRAISRADAYLQYLKWYQRNELWPAREKTRIPEKFEFELPDSFPFEGRLVRARSIDYNFDWGYDFDFEIVDFTTFDRFWKRRAGEAEVDDESNSEIEVWLRIEDVKHDGPISLQCSKGEFYRKVSEGQRLIHPVVWSAPPHQSATLDWNGLNIILPRSEKKTPSSGMPEGKKTEVFVREYNYRLTHIVTSQLNRGAGQTQEVLPILVEDSETAKDLRTAFEHEGWNFLVGYHAQPDGEGKYRGELELSVGQYRCRCTLNRKDGVLDVSEVQKGVAPRSDDRRTARFSWRVRVLCKDEEWEGKGDFDSVVSLITALETRVEEREVHFNAREREAHRPYEKWEAVTEELERREIEKNTYQIGQKITWVGNQKGAVSDYSVARRLDESVVHPKSWALYHRKGARIGRVESVDEEHGEIRVSFNEEFDFGCDLKLVVEQRNQDRLAKELGTPDSGRSLEGNAAGSRAKRNEHLSFPVARKNLVFLPNSGVEIHNKELVAQLGASDFEFCACILVNDDGETLASLTEIKSKEGVIWLELEKEFARNYCFRPINIVPYARQRLAIERLKSGDFLNPDIANGVLAPDSVKLDTESRYCEGVAIDIDDLSGSRLNQAQKETLSKALKCWPLFSIQGPPGTGKTTLIVEIVSRYLRRYPDARILIASQANVAVDNALEGLQKNLEAPIVRVGREEKVSANVRKNTLDEQLTRWTKGLEDESDLANSTEQSLRANWRELLRDPELRDSILLRAANVIGATCVGLGTTRGDLRFLEFDLVIVDEAGRATAPETLLPLMRARRAILIGDQAQLPPVVTEDMRLALESVRESQEEHTPKIDVEWLRESLFEKMHRELPTEATGFLDTQYRMLPAISDLVSRVFYDGELESARDEPRLFEAFRTRVVWLDTSCNTSVFAHEKFYEQQFPEAEDDFSVYNPGEAKVVGDLARTFERLLTEQDGNEPVTIPLVFV
jgi:hypothetical protein